jgi:hypothetical protein
MTKAWLDDKTGRDIKKSQMAKLNIQPEHKPTSQGQINYGRARCKRASLIPPQSRRFCGFVL